MNQRENASCRSSVLIDCTKPHRYYSETGWHVLWVHFDGAPYREYYNLILRQNGKVFSTHMLHSIHDGLRSIYDIFHQQQPLSESKMALYLTQALTAMTKPVESLIASDHICLIDQAITCINQNVGNEPFVAELARTVGLSEYHFIRVFRDVIGMTPRQYIIASRMNHARYLLKTTMLPIGEIAGMVGYTSESMFSADFRRTQSITPSQYRTGTQPCIREESP